MIRFRNGLVTAILVLASGLDAQVARVGDPGSVPDPSKFDERIPEMAEWAKAGVQGGIPLVVRVVATVKPGENLAQAIKNASVSPGNHGVLLLAPGVYDLGTETLQLKPGLVLRGSGRDVTELSSRINAGRKEAIKLVSHAGLEDLTIYSALVKEKPEESYQGKYSNLGDPSTTLVNVGGAKNAWIQRCNLYWAGSHPIDVGWGAAHCTFRDNHIAKSYNKGGQGNGYLHFGESTHLLFFNERIEDLRHVSIMWKANHNVFYKCKLNVDINYHAGLPHSNLVEDCEIKRRPGHHWSPICFGWQPWQKEGPGPRNFLWNNRWDGDGSGNQKIWILRDTTPDYANMKELLPMAMDFGAPPKAGTLYAVTGQPITFEEKEVREALEGMAQSRSKGQWKEATMLAKKVRSFSAPGSERFKEAQAIFDEMNKRARTALEAQLAKPSEVGLRRFISDWPEASCVDEARTVCNQFGVEQLQRLGGPSNRISTFALEKFLNDWSGFPVHEQALTIYREMARADMDSLNASNEEQRLRALKRYIDKWKSGTPLELLAEFEAGTKKMLETAKAEPEAQMRYHALNNFKQNFAGSPAADEATKIMETMMKEALKKQGK